MTSSDHAYTTRALLDAGASQSTLVGRAWSL
jgi:hypothetical protein